MNNKPIEFSRKYSAKLRKYLHEGADIKSARSLGLEAFAAAFGLLDLARIHEESLSAELHLARSGTSLAQLIRSGSVFFAEVITPTAQAYRTARNAAVRAKQLNDSLSKRTAELAVSKSELKRETALRAHVEKALTERERHYGHLLEESARLQEQLRHLSHRILSTQEEERKKISRELHDHVASTLAGINLELNTLKSEATGNNIALKRNIARTQRLVRNSVEIVHRFARELRPASLDDLGLIPALFSFTKALSKQTGIRIDLTAFAAVEELSNMKRTVLYRLTQEALNNVATHAQASRVAVTIKKVSQSVVLTVKDDGKSFEVERFLLNTKNGRLGLLGMRERTEMVGGTFSVESARGTGTTVQAIIPIPSRRRNATRHEKK